MSAFPVFCTASLSKERLLQFLNVAWINFPPTGFGQHHPILMASIDPSEGIHRYADETTPLEFNTSTSNTFLGLTPSEVAASFADKPRVNDGICWDTFAILDETSITDDSGLICQGEENVTETVRVHFDTILGLRTSFNLSYLSIEELQPVAEKQGGVLRMDRPESIKKMNNGYLPRKQLKKKDFPPS